MTITHQQHALIDRVIREIYEARAQGKTVTKAFFGRDETSLFDHGPKGFEGMTLAGVPVEQYPGKSFVGFEYGEIRYAETMKTLRTWLDSRYPSVEVKVQPRDAVAPPHLGDGA